MKGIAELILVHGAGSGPWVFDGWDESFGGIALTALDLQRGLRVETASMAGYASAVEERAREARRPFAVCGWSMGGLVAMMAAPAAPPERLVVIEPSPPGEVQGFDPGITPVPGAFDPNDVYGPVPPGLRTRPESSPARAERKRGISVPVLPCPLLVVYGRDYAEDRGRSVARHYAGDEAAFPNLGHFDLVRAAAVRDAIGEWLGRPAVQPPEM
jgi:pimeloyl-ACP methyl ester carboxylesterase